MPCKQALGQRAALRPNGVEPLDAKRLYAVFLRNACRVKIAHERAAQRAVDELATAADAKDRQAACIGPAEKRKLYVYLLRPLQDPRILPRPGRFVARKRRGNIIPAA